MIRALEFHNFCRYEKRRVELKPGMNALIGPNGSGKSTILVGAAGCLTGQFSEFHGTRTDNIRCTASDKAKSWVSMDMALKGGQEVTLTRHLRPSGQELQVGKRVCTKLNEVQDEVGRWLGMDPKTFVEFAFAFQWELFSILEARPSDRAKSLHRLFRLDLLEDGYERLNKRLVALQVPVPAIDVDAAKQRLKEATDKLRDLKAQRAALTPPCENEVASAQELLDALRRREALSKQSVALWGTQNELADEYAKAEADLAEVKHTLDEMQALHDRDAQIKALADQQLWKEHERWDARYKLLHGQRVCFEASKPVEPIIPPWTTADTYAAEHLHFDLVEAQKHLDRYKLAAKSGSTCGACGQPIPYSKELHDDCARRVEDLQKAYTAKKEAHKEVEIATALWHAYRAKQARYEERMNSLTQQLAELGPEPITPTRSVADLAKIVNDFAKLTGTIDGLNQEHNELLESTVRLEAKLASVSQQKAECDAALTKITTDAVREKWAKEVLRLAEQVKTDLIRYETQETVLREGVAQTETDIKAAQEILAKAAKINNWRTVLTNVRSTFHRDSLPKALAQKNLEGLGAGVNKYLEELGVDFRIKVGDDLSFIALFPDGRVVPAERLSGGEKVVFALAWRLTVNSTFAGDIGLLCLDEPTAGLDGERLECLRRAMQRLKLLAGTHGLQCIVVTHERSLMPVFDHFVELPSS